jgi:hypothetical protein
VPHIPTADAAGAAWLYMPCNPVDCYIPSLRVLASLNQHGALEAARPHRADAISERSAADSLQALRELTRRRRSGRRPPLCD